MAWPTSYALTSNIARIAVFLDSFLVRHSFFQQVMQISLHAALCLRDFVYNYNFTQVLGRKHERFWDVPWLALVWCGTTILSYNLDSKKCGSCTQDASPDTVRGLSYHIRTGVTQNLFLSLRQTILCITSCWSSLRFDLQVGLSWPYFGERDG